MMAASDPSKNLFSEEDDTDDMFHSFQQPTGELDSMTSSTNSKKALSSASPLFQEDLTDEINLNGDQHESSIPPRLGLNEESPPKSSLSTSLQEIDETTAKQIVSQPTPTESTRPSILISRKSTSEVEDDHDEGPLATVDITIGEFEKKGEGMNSYVVYKVLTKGNNVSGYPKREYEVWRRFSDFLGLHEKLRVKHLENGRIVPPAPDKSVFGTTKSKISKTVEDEGTADFLERRRAALERFVKRTARHPSLYQDPDFREFLTFEGDLPKATQTSALSGANIMKIVSRVNDSFSKITFKMEESEPWFEDKFNEIEVLDEQLRKLHSSMEALVHHRKELAVSTDAYCKSMSMLASCEENTALSRAFSQLAETQEKVGLVQADQSEKDFYLMAEMLRDYIGLLATVKEVFHEREKVWNNWQSAQTNLARKRESKTKLELQGRTDKLPSARKEVEEAEQKVQEWEESFQKISKIVKKEMRRFDAQRVRDFKETILAYLESLALTQQQVIKYWEAFLPEAKAINV